MSEGADGDVVDGVYTEVMLLLRHSITSVGVRLLVRPGNKILVMICNLQGICVIVLFA